MQTSPTIRKRTLPLWALLLSIAIVSFAFVFIPAWLIQPFKSQTVDDLGLSYTLKAWSPTLTVIALLGSIAIAVLVWRRSRRWWGKAALILPFILLGVSAWFAQQNHFEWMFKPLPNSAFVSAKNVDFVSDNEMVLAVEINNDAVAFPVRQIAYHHVVHDVVGGKPIVATY